MLCLVEGSYMRNFSLLVPSVGILLIIFPKCVSGVAFVNPDLSMLQFSSTADYFTSAANVRPHVALYSSNKTFRRPLFFYSVRGEIHRVHLIHLSMDPYNVHVVTDAQVTMVTACYVHRLHRLTKGAWLSLRHSGCTMQN